MHVVLVVGVEREKAHAPVEGHMGLRREGGCGRSLDDQWGCQVMRRSEPHLSPALTHCSSGRSLLASAVL